MAAQSHASDSALDAAVAASAERAFGVLELLVAQRSTIGHESGAEDVLAEQLTDLGFGITRVPIPHDVHNDPAAGVPIVSYDNRYSLVGERGATGGTSLIINGHIDVVPADDASRWSSPPFVPTRRDGWLVGRGAADMKGGFAAGLLALWALDAAAPGWLDGSITVIAAIEEEATGNGTLATARAGYLADAAILLEPTDLDLLLGGIALIWVSIEVEGRAGHAEAASSSINPVLGVQLVIDGLRTLEERLNREHVDGPRRDEGFAQIAHPYNLNVGRVHAGDWASSVPSVARLEVRVGHPAHLTAESALAEVQAAVLASTGADPWLREHPPILRLSGYRAQRYLQNADAPLVTALSAAHESAHGTVPDRVTIGSTTDARFYVNQFAMPAVAYGPRTRNMHGTDEAVELASIVDCARTVARFVRDWYVEGSAR